MIGFAPPKIIKATQPMKLTSLTLQHCNIRNLSDVMNCHLYSKLTYLDLSHNKINLEGFLTVAKYFSSHFPVMMEILILDDNFLDRLMNYKGIIYSEEAYPYLDYLSLSNRLNYLESSEKHAILREYLPYKFCNKRTLIATEDIMKNTVYFHCEYKDKVIALFGERNSGKSQLFRSLTKREFNELHQYNKDTSMITIGYRRYELIDFVGDQMSKIEVIKSID